MKTTIEKETRRTCALCLDSRLKESHTCPASFLISIRYIRLLLVYYSSRFSLTFTRIAPHSPIWFENYNEISLFLTPIYLEELSFFLLRHYFSLTNWTITPATESDSDGPARIGLHQEESQIRTEEIALSNSYRYIDTITLPSLLTYFLRSFPQKAAKPSPRRTFCYSCYRSFTSEGYFQVRLAFLTSSFFSEGQTTPFHTTRSLTPPLIRMLAAHRIWRT